MKTNKRIIRKNLYQRYSSADGFAMGPPTEQEYFATEQKTTGKGWNLLSDIFGTATAFFQGGWKQPYQDQNQLIVQPKPNNTPLYIGLGIVLVLVFAVILTRK